MTLLSKVTGTVQPNIGVPGAGQGSTHAGVGTKTVDRLQEASSLNEAGRHSQALTVVDEALGSLPGNAELKHARASILFAWCRHREARDAYLQAAAAGMLGAAFELELGWAHFHCADFVAAEGCMRRALAADPDNSTTRVGLARVIFETGRFADAEIALRAALELCPGHAECLWLLGNCRLCQRDAVAGEFYLRNAIESEPERAVMWKDLGAALDAQDRWQEAIEASTTATRLDEQCNERGDAFVNLAILLLNQGRISEALALHEKFLPQRPYVYGHIAYAQALLKAGRLQEGWHQNEFRLLRGPAMSVHKQLGRPAWSGQSLQGKAILLWAEQGLGDLIQFVRYAPRLKALGAKVMLRVPDGLEAFAQGFPGIDRVLERGPARVEFDHYLNLVSLPCALDSGAATIPAEIPYLHPDTSFALRWASRIPSCEHLKVGVAWAGNPDHPNDRFRSMALRELAPLGELDGVLFYSLQMGAREEEAKAPPPGFRLLNLGPELDDIRDTAAVIDQLDVILSVDTAVAHLAGALGKPVWLMLPKAADWRWLEGRDDSPWYTTMRLFRQRRLGDWGDVIEQVVSAFRQQLQVRGAAAVQDSIPPARTRGAGATAAAAGLDVPPALDALVQRTGFSGVAGTRTGILQYLPDQALVGDSLRWYGEWLQPQLDLLAQLVRPGATLVEIGSGVGAHTIPLAVMANTDGHLLLYESRPVLRQILRQNLVANRVGNATLMRRSAAGSSALDGAGRAKLASAEQSESPVETVDDLQLSRLDLIKIAAQVDVTTVLAGATATLWRVRPSLFIAVEAEGALAEPARRLRDFGYRCWRMESALFSPNNFNRREDDIFSGQTALALVAVPEEMGVDMTQDGCVELS